MLDLRAIRGVCFVQRLQRERERVVLRALLGTWDVDVQVGVCPLSTVVRLELPRFTQPIEFVGWAKLCEEQVRRNCVEFGWRLNENNLHSRHAEHV